MQAMESDFTRDLPIENSGVNGLPSMASPYPWNFAGKLPFERRIRHINEDVEQVVGYGELADTWIVIPGHTQYATLATADASDFDAFISPFFGEFTNVDRTLWPLALRWRAANDAMSKDRQEKKLPRLIRVSIMINGDRDQFLLYPAPQI